MNIFNLPHIFIIFNPGSGGNFIAGLLNSLAKSKLNPIHISLAGSSHTITTFDKANGTDFLSFGTLTEEHAFFPSQDIRINHYLNNISKNYADVTDAQIVWSHDFTNIPIYRKYFKNAKILVITNYTDEECITSVIMNTLKTLLDEKASIPLTKQHWDHAVQRWKKHCVPFLADLVETDKIEPILQDRFNPEHKDVISFASIRMFMRYFCMLNLVGEKSVGSSGFNYVLHQSNPTQSPPYKVGKYLYDYVDSDCTVLPYEYLSKNNVDLLIEKLSNVLCRALTAEESDFIKTEFYKYRRAQDQTLLDDPRKFFNNLKNKVTKKL